MVGAFWFFLEGKGLRGGFEPIKRLGLGMLASKEKGRGFIERNAFCFLKMERIRAVPLF